AVASTRPARWLSFWFSTAVAVDASVSAVRSSTSSAGVSIGDPPVLHRRPVAEKDWQDAARHYYRTSAAQSGAYCAYPLAAARPVFTPVTRLRKLQYLLGVNPLLGCEPPSKRQPALPNLGLAIP